MSRTAFPRLMLNLAAAALLTATVAGQAQADTVWHFPYKGAPYAAPHDHGRGAALGQKMSKSTVFRVPTAKRTHTHTHTAGMKYVIR